MNDCDLIALAQPGAASLKPYVPGKPVSELERELGIRNIVKLASNENPLGPSPKALQAIAAAANDIARYPDASGHELKAALAAKHGVEPAQITLGNGSNDVLVLLALGFLQPGKNAVMSEYCFAVYPIATQQVGAEIRWAKAYDADHEMALGHDLDALANAVTEDTRLVFVANPNNPTGTWVSKDDLVAFAQRLPHSTLLVVDEAYIEYTDAGEATSMVDQLATMPNLVVSRTFSKAFGLAALRVGYTLSHPTVADVLNRIRQPFNVGALGLVGAQAALNDHDYLAQSKSVNDAGMQLLSGACADLGLGIVPSRGNFVLVDCKREAQPVFDALLHAGVIVRPVANYGLPNHLRLSIGLPEENQRLIKALPAALQA